MARRRTDPDLYIYITGHCYCYVCMGRSISQASAQFQVRDPTVEREGPVVPLYGPFDCWQNPQTTPLTHLIGLPVHPTNIPLAPMYPPEFDIPPPEPPEP
eukprot:scaffold1497_cov128-Isochrysis_galbana.AAC.6